MNKVAIILLVYGIGVPALSAGFLALFRQSRPSKED